MRPSTTKNDNTAEMISTPSQAENIYVRKKPNKEELSLINLIAKETSSEQLSFELINSLIYSSAVALKQHLNDITLKSSNDRNSTEPK